MKRGQNMVYFIEFQVLNEYMGPLIEKLDKLKQDMLSLE
jgi:hypothetical protein